jgi:hypothetical protein
MAITLAKYYRAKNYLSMGYTIERTAELVGLLPSEVWEIAEGMSNG